MRRLRAVAFLHCFFDIAKPSRDLSSSFLRHSTVNHLSRLRVAFSNTRPNDAASSNRQSLLNRCRGLRSKSDFLLAGKTAALALGANGGRLRRQLRAAFCPAALDNEATCFGRHAGTKTMRAGALQFAGLIRTFHLPGTWIYVGQKNPVKQKGGKGTWQPASCQ